MDHFASFSLPNFIVIYKVLRLSMIENFCNLNRFKLATNHRNELWTKRSNTIINPTKPPLPSPCPKKLLRVHHCSTRNSRGCQLPNTMRLVSTRKPTKYAAMLNPSVLTIWKYLKIQSIITRLVGATSKTLRYFFFSRTLLCC